MLDSSNLNSFDKWALPLACRSSLCISKGSEKLILIEWFPSFLENIDQPQKTKLFYICSSRVTVKSLQHSVYSYHRDRLASGRHQLVVQTQQHVTRCEIRLYWSFCSHYGASPVMNNLKFSLSHGFRNVRPSWWGGHGRITQFTSYQIRNRETRGFWCSPAYRIEPSTSRVGTLPSINHQCKYCCQHIPWCILPACYMILHAVKPESKYQPPHVCSDQVTMTTECPRSSI